MADNFFNLSQLTHPGPTNTPAASQTNNTAHPLFSSGVDYTVKKANWFTSKPYGFKFTPRDGKGPFTMFLPISPSNLVIQTSFATNVIPTLYGTVEEHSPVRYYDITIEGTTGIAPQYIDIIEAAVPSIGRTRFSVVEGLSNIAGGFFIKTLSLVDKALNNASDLIAGAPEPETGVFTNQTGYLAFHNLYRFLLKYKEDASGDKNSSQRTKHPLTFFNYKDNNAYDVVVRNFVLKRSAENPMLYYYSITMRGYNLRDASTVGTAPQDETTDTLKKLGLNGVDSSSLLGKIKSTANKAKGILGPLGAGINVLGR